MKNSKFDSIVTEFSSIFNSLIAVWTQIIVRVLIRLMSVSRLLFDWKSRSFLWLLPVKVSFSWKSILFFFVLFLGGNPVPVLAF